MTGLGTVSVHSFTDMTGPCIVGAHSLMVCTGIAGAQSCIICTDIAGLGVVGVHSFMTGLGGRSAC